MDEAEAPVTLSAKTFMDDCTCEGMPAHGKVERHAGHFPGCVMCAPRCMDHDRRLRVSCSVCRNAAAMTGSSASLLWSSEPSGQPEDSAS